MSMSFFQSLRRNRSKLAASHRACAFIEPLESRTFLSGTMSSMMPTAPVVSDSSIISPALQTDASTAPAFTSAASTTFPVSTAGTFTITTTGSPVPALKEVGTLPTGVTFVDNADGTATLAGTPAAGTAGLYVLKLHARNGTSPAAKQVFDLTVAQAPAITTKDHVTFSAGVSKSFTVSTSGFPLPTLKANGTLPSGVTFVDNHNGTATISGAASGPAAVYTLKINAKNGTAPNAKQSFTLTVTQTGTAPAFTSSQSSVDWLTNVDYATGAEEPPVIFTTSGSPTAVLTETGALPSGVTFVDNHNGTATLSGTPASSGVFTLTISAANGISPAAEKTFTLTVQNFY